MGLGAVHGPHFLANSDHRNDLTLHSPAQLTVHNNGIFFLSLLGCPWANATSCAPEEWQKFNKSCINHINQMLLLLLTLQCFSVT